MVIILYVLGLLQIAGGILAAVEAKSAIHQILGATSFGLGTLAIGLAAILARVAVAQARRNN